MVFYTYVYKYIYFKRTGGTTKVYHSWKSFKKKSLDGSLNCIQIKLYYKSNSVIFSISVGVSETDSFGELSSQKLIALIKLFLA